MFFFKAEKGNQLCQLQIVDGAFVDVNIQSSRFEKVQSALLLAQGLNHFVEMLKLEKSNGKNENLTSP